jgi:hypothetical protein
VNRRHSLTSTVVLAAAVLLAGCSQADDTTATSSGDAMPTAEGVPTGHADAPRGGSLRDVDEQDPDAVADAVAAAMYTYDTRLDLSPADATRRARSLLSARMAAAVASPMPGGGGAEWLDLAAHDGYTTVTVERVEEAGAPPDTMTEAYRQRRVRVTSHGADGWTRPARITHLFITLTRDSSTDPWRVDGVTVQE